MRGVLLSTLCLPPTTSNANLLTALQAAVRKAGHGGSADGVRLQELAGMVNALDSSSVASLDSFEEHEVV
jgi:hypothetical protein